ncbi:putative Ufm1-specific protease [Dorcoceras hygrometricum]|uniref:Putative Ufm1-specific protease n=1 Tax=Dorcoceras hygrometricum TaxID=472368 RepID=A0A2Z7ADI1_9LAMI|nr:putative Ufm1-specific protease [Dorcoceras hygrometricum]
MREKSYNAPELIQEDLLCVFGFSKRGVELVGDLDERMGKAELLNAMQEEAHRGDPKMTRESTPPKRVSEEIPDLPPVITISEASSPVRGKGPERVPPLDYSKDSLVDSPTGVVATRYICNMAPDRDLQVLERADDIEAVGHFAANMTSAMAWGGEHAEVVARLEELEVLRAREDGAAKAQREALEAELPAEKEARAAEKEALGAELEGKGWAEQEAERLKSDAREEFLKSPEFDALLAKKAWGYFKDGFWGCLAQFRANGYSEEEHPASLLDVQQALAEVGDKEEAEEEEEEHDEEEGG